MMRKSRCQNLGQLVLELESQSPRLLVGQNTQGLVEALADLLLEALRGEEMTETGGVDEQQDHA